jgi:type IV pilus assembly protein PilZ
MTTPTLIAEFNDQQHLLAAYMPFIHHGGLFIITNERYALHTEVTIALKLFYEKEMQAITGKIIWITPALAFANRRAGVGVQFNPDAAALRSQIENCLGALLSPDQPTDTL